jgi:hypothetical protein
MKMRIVALTVILILVLAVSVVSAQGPAGNGSEGDSPADTAAQETDADPQSILAPTGPHPLDDHWGQWAAGFGKKGSKWTNNATLPSVYGVWGVIGRTNPGAFSAALRGENRGTGGNGIGVWGSQNGGGWGVYGAAPSGLGVYGSSSSGTGVYGYSASNVGVYGLSSSGWGAFFARTASSGTRPGLEGRTSSTSGSAVGVLGRVTPTNAGGYSAAVYGINSGTGGNGIGVRGYHGGSGWGVYGSTPSGLGVYGYSTTGTGVYAGSNSGRAGFFYRTAGSGTTPALEGRSSSTASYAVGVLGQVTPTNPGSNSTGVRGISAGTGGLGIGVWGSQAGSGWGVFGSVPSNTAGYAGYFSGRVYVSGALLKGGGGFKIDHPLDPANKYLYHSFVESPDMLNIYNGSVELDANGEALVEMPDWFEALNRDFQYQLTPIGAPGPDLYVAEEISNNAFKIAGGSEGLMVSWQVTGIRHDAFADANRLPVEEDKPQEELGSFLYPELFGESPDKSLTSRLQGGLTDQPVEELYPAPLVEQLQAEPDLAIDQLETPDQGLERQGQ